MNAEFKAKWVEALRSGKYEQGRRRLRANDQKFCCLAVACDIHDPGAWRKEGQRGWTFMGQINYAPSSIDIPLATQSVLADMNDEERLTFAQIADYIEANL